MARTEPFGIDVSRWQDKMNWDAVASHASSVQFAGIRAGVSWGYQDSWFRWNWDESKRVGIPRGAYHVVYPGESVQRQMDAFLATVGEDRGELPLILDCELDHGLSVVQINRTIEGCVDYLYQKTQRMPLLYTRANWVDTYITGKGTPPAWLQSVDWWLAQYLKSGVEHPGPVAIPKGVKAERVLIHQTSDKGKPIGCGAAIKTMDYNRWIGTGSRSITEYLRGTAPAKPEPTAEAQELRLDLEHLCQQMEAAAADLADVRDRYIQLIGMG